MFGLFRKTARKAEVIKEIEASKIEARIRLREAEEKLAKLESSLETCSPEFKRMTRNLIELQKYVVDGLRPLCR